MINDVLMPQRGRPASDHMFGSAHLKVLSSINNQLACICQSLQDLTVGVSRMLNSLTGTAAVQSTALHAKSSTPLGCRVTHMSYITDKLHCYPASSS